MAPESSMFDFITTLDPEVYIMLLLFLVLSFAFWMSHMFMLTESSEYQPLANEVSDRWEEQHYQQRMRNDDNVHISANSSDAVSGNYSRRGIPYKRNKVNNNQDMPFNSENKSMYERTLADQNRKIHNLESRLKEEESRLKKETNKLAYLENQVRMLEGKNRSLDDSLGRKDSELRSIRDQNKQMVDTLEKTRREKEDVLRRLSQYVGERLVQNNPNIADLNDPYRPSKLAELSNEISDNEWTSAYTCLNDNGVSDNECVLILLQIVMGIHSLCQENINNRIQELVAENDGSVTKIKEVMKKNGGTNQAYMCNVFLPNILRGLETSKPGISSSDEIKVYIKSCFELCWYMAIQDPPCVFQCYPGNVNDVTVPAGTKLSREYFKEYTKRGPIIDFIVWPIMLLDVKQPYRILSKGVAEGRKG